MLTPGNVSDVKAATALLERAGRMRYLLGDKGYDASAPPPGPRCRCRPGNPRPAQPQARHPL